MVCLFQTVTEVTSGLSERWFAHSKWWLKSRLACQKDGLLIPNGDWSHVWPFRKMVFSFQMVTEVTSGLSERRFAHSKWRSHTFGLKADHVWEESSIEGETGLTGEMWAVINLHTTDSAHQPSIHQAAKLSSTCASHVPSACRLAALQVLDEMTTNITTVLTWHRWHSQVRWTKVITFRRVRARVWVSQSWIVFQC